MNLTQNEAIDAYIDGKILFEPRQRVTTFMLWGRWYTSTMRRTVPYAFDNKTWVLNPVQGIVQKLLLILIGNVHSVRVR